MGMRLLYENVCDMTVAMMMMYRIEEMCYTYDDGWFAFSLMIFPLVVVEVLLCPLSLSSIHSRNMQSC